MDDDHAYLPIRDAVSSVNQKVNLWATVVEFGLPRKSKGTDFVCTLKIMDTSYQEPGLSVNFFAGSMEKLPHVKLTGDIIRLHRVVIKVRNGVTYAVFNKRFSSFVLFHGEASKGFTPYQAPTEFEITDHDKKFINQLIPWLGSYQFDAGLNEYSLQLREIKNGRYFDLVCQILHTSEVPEDGWILFVWDGTDAPPVSFEMSLDVEAEESLTLSRDVLCTFPRVGTVLRVIAGKSFGELGLQFQGRRQWVKLRNIVCQLRSGLWYGALTPSSRLRLLSDGESTVMKRQKCYSERVSSKLDRLPLSSFPWPSPVTDISQTRCKKMAFSTLMDILCHSEVTYIFKCVVRVVATYPWEAKDFWSPVTGVYRIRLTLEDPTARIYADVYEEDGVQLFNGYPPPDVLTSKMNKLLGIAEFLVDGGGNASRNPPWVQCYIKSYYLDESDKWGTRHYRICGTNLVG